MNDIFYIVILLYNIMLLIDNSWPFKYIQSPDLIYKSKLYTVHYRYCTVAVHPEGGSVVFNVKSCILCDRRSINSPLLYNQLLYFDAGNMSAFKTFPTKYLLYILILMYMY